MVMEPKRSVEMTVVVVHVEPAHLVKNVAEERALANQTALVDNVVMMAVVETLVDPVLMAKPVTRDFARELESELALEDLAVMTELVEAVVLVRQDKDVVEEFANASIHVLIEIVDWHLKSLAQSVLKSVVELAPMSIHVPLMVSATSHFLVIFQLKFMMESPISMFRNSVQS